MSKELDLAALRLVVLVDEQGSLGSAARSLGISQPAASASLRAFEARWRFQVAERSPRGTRLTADGLTVASWARDVLHRVDTMRGSLEALGHTAGSDVSELAIAASLTVAEFVLPRWLGELRVVSPELRIRLQVVNSHAADDLVHDGDCELGFVETRRISPDLASRVVGSDRLVIVVPSRHPWARRSTPLTRGQLLEAEYVVREMGSGTRETFERALGAEPAVAMVATSTTALVGAVLAGVAPAVVTPRAVMAAVEVGRLSIVPHELDLERPLTAVWRRDRPLSGPGRELIRIACLSQP
jgi:DNA-binding transcriptional LysR family regulator